jgi:NAD-dependent deacetylase
MTCMESTLQIENAIDLINKSNHIVALSGAGISTEAGIPDFRGPSGLWENASMMEQLSVSNFRRNPESFYKSSLQLFSTMDNAQPTLAHKLLARLEELGKIEAVVTQNIDGLHTAAGSKKVFELHGAYRTGHCPKCGARFKMAEYYARIAAGDLKVPRCHCGSIIKPDVVLFEDMLPVEAWQGSVEAVEKSDLMLVFGSSLVVYPAAELPMMAVTGGASLVIVNMEETGYDGIAAVAVKSRLGDFAKQALAALA